MTKNKDFDFLGAIDKINEYATCAEDGIIAGDFDGFIDSGSYSVNALLSGSIYGGWAQNKIGGVSGESGSGKTFFLLTSLKLFLDKDPKALGVLFESESAISKNMLTEFGIDVKRVMVFPIATVQHFRHQALVILNNYAKQPKEERRPIMVMLDSLGMLSTTKEIEDIEEGKETVDMTRAKLIKGAFRVLTLKLGYIGVPLLLSNHTYKTQSLYSQTVQGGGSGVQYAPSTNVFISKSKEKLGTDIVGNYIHCTLNKSRLTKEYSKVDTLIRYETGLSRWYGMIDFAIEAGVWKKAGSRVEVHDGAKPYAKQIYTDTEKYFEDNIMEAIDKYVGTQYLYGSAQKKEENVAEDIKEAEQELEEIKKEVDSNNG